MAWPFGKIKRAIVAALQATGKVPGAARQLEANIGSRYEQPPPAVISAANRARGCLVLIIVGHHVATLGSKRWWLVNPAEQATS